MNMRSGLFLQEMGIAVQWQRKHLLLAMEDAAVEAAAPDAGEAVLANLPAAPTATGADVPIALAIEPIAVADGEAKPALTAPLLKRPAILEKIKTVKPAAVNRGTGPAAGMASNLMADGAMPDDAMPWFDADMPLPSNDDYIPDAAPEWLDFPVDETPSREELIAAMNWQQLQQAASTCTACGLCRQRQQSVFGRGSENPAWVMTGDTPSREDEAAGAPFSGDEATLLENMLRAIGRTQQVYFTNLVKCRAQDEHGQRRAPNPDEIAACRPILQRQIDLLQPRLILALGKTAALALRSPDAAGALRGTVHQALGKPMVASWHPAILLRQPLEKRQAWSDLCLAKQADGG